MNIDFHLSDNDLDRIANKITAAIRSELHSTSAPWLDARGAAEHLGMTTDAIRGLVKRNRIPVHRTESGRVRFDRSELDAWVRDTTHEA